MVSYSASGSCVFVREATVGPTLPVHVAPGLIHDSCVARHPAVFNEGWESGVAAPEVPVGGHEQLRVGKVAEILAERGTAWEHRLFPAALTRARRRHRVSAPGADAALRSTPGGGMGHRPDAGASADLRRRGAPD